MKLLEENLLIIILISMDDLIDQEKIIKMVICYFMKK